MASLALSYLAHAAFVGTAANDVLAVSAQTQMPNILTVDRLIEHTSMAPALRERRSAYSCAGSTLRANEMTIGEANGPARTR